MNDLLTETAEPLFDDTKDYFTDLVGEGKKFRDEKELAKAKVRSDLYIQDILKRQDQTLAEYDSLKKQYDARASLEEKMDQLESLYASRETPPKADIQSPPPKQLPPEDEFDKFDKFLSAREKAKQEQSNLESSKKMLKEQLGDNYVQVIRERIEGLELSETDVNALAKRSPKTLARILGIEKQEETLFQAPPTSQKRNDSFKPSALKRTWSYYQNLKASQPRLYLDPKIAVQMHNDHIAMGSQFEDGDFHQNN